MDKTVFRCVLTSDSYVYDGDTLEHIHVHLGTFDGVSDAVLWPGIFLKDGELYTVTNIRVAGVDAPERHPEHAGRTEASLEAERALSLVARQLVLDLLHAHDGVFTIANPIFGKYAGRTVAEVYFGDGNDGNDRVNLADVLIEKGLGYAYSGESKMAFDDWYGSGKD